MESTQLSLKGEIKKQEQAECKYGPDGKVQETPIGAPPEPKKKPGGLRGKIVEKKVDELKDYMDRFGSLVSRYVPPDPQSMQAAFQAGKAELVPPGSLVFTDCIKPGDKVTISQNPATRKLREYGVSTYLDSPDDAVGIEVNFPSLADGTNHVEQVVLTSAKKELQIKTTNFDYK